MSFTADITPTLVAQLTPPSDLTGAAGAALINAALAQIPPGFGTQIRLAPTAPWDIAGGLISVTQSGVYIDASGCYIRHRGAGDLFNFTDASTYATRTLAGGGLRGKPIIDGTATTGASCPFHGGDIVQLECDMIVQNYTQAGSLPFHADNREYWTEQGRFWVAAKNYVGGLTFDNSANLSGFATGSFDRTMAWLFPGATGADGLVMQGGAFIIDGAVALTGNFGTSTGGPFASVRLTGSNGGGFSGLQKSMLFLGCELDDTVHTAPTTVIFGSASNAVYKCRGLLDWSGANPFTASNNAGQFLFAGEALGDSTLYCQQNLDNPPFTQAITANNQTIFTQWFPLSRCTNGNASFTGLILQQGFWPGQRVTVYNHGTGTLTFAVAGTSNVADGVTSPIAANAGRTFIWDTTDSLWYRLNG